MPESEPNQQPTPVIIEGADSRLARLLIRAAHERQDVEVTDVVWCPGDRITPQDFNHLTAHDSVYGNVPEIPVRLHPEDSNPENVAAHVKNMSAVVVALGRQCEDFMDRYDTPWSAGYDAFGNVIIVGAHPWGHGGNQTINPIITIAGMFFEEDGFRANYVPSARLQAILPVLHVFNKDKGLIAADVTEIRSYAEPQALLDQTNPVRTIQESRSPLRGSIPNNTGGDWLDDYLDDEFLDRDIQAIRKLLMERSFSIPTAAGSRAVVSVQLQDRFSQADIVELLDSTHLVHQDEIISSYDVIGGSAPGYFAADSVSINGQRAQFEIAYDSDWSWAHRILDIATKITTD